MRNHDFAFLHLPWSCRPLERCSLPLSNASDSSLFDPSQCFEKEKVLIQRCIFCWLKGYFCGNTKATGRVTSPLNIWWIVDARCGVVQVMNPPYSPFLVSVRRLAVLPLSHHQKEPLVKKIDKFEKLNFPKTQRDAIRTFGLKQSKCCWKLVTWSNFKGMKWNISFPTTFLFPI